MAKYDIPFDIAIEYDSRQLDSFKFQDIQRAVASLAREARSRVKDLRKMEDEYGRSPALAKYDEWRIDKGSGAYSARYKNKNALLQEFAELKNFLDDETGTVEGYKNFIKEFDRKFDFESTKEDRDEFWRIYNQHVQSLSQTSIFFSSDRIMRDMKLYIRDFSVTEKDSEGNERKTVPWKQIETELAKEWQEPLMSQKLK